jgi:hypothetical protein
MTNRTKTMTSTTAAQIVMKYTSWADGCREETVMDTLRYCREMGVDYDVLLDAERIVLLKIGAVYPDQIGNAALSAGARAILAQDPTLSEEYATHSK